MIREQDDSCGRITNKRRFRTTCGRLRDCEMTLVPHALLPSTAWELDENPYTRIIGLF